MLSSAIRIDMTADNNALITKVTMWCATADEEVFPRKGAKAQRRIGNSSLRLCAFARKKYD
jgi:hypothetical protein